MQVCIYVRMHMVGVVSYAATHEHKNTPTHQHNIHLRHIITICIIQTYLPVYATYIAHAHGNTTHVHTTHTFHTC